MSAPQTTAPARSGPRRSLLRDERGQIIIFYLIFAIPMAMLLFSVYNVGQLTAEKQKIQLAADNAAYSAAVWEARYMNLTAYMNRAMVANYDTMAMILSLWSIMDAWDGFLYLIDFIVEKIPIINALSAITKPLHVAVHNIDKAMAQVVGGSKSGKQRLLYVIETYNRVLSYAQRALYFLNQAGRKRVIESIAWGVDPKIQYLSWGEIINAISQNARMKWEGTDKDKGLRLTTTRSLNEFSRGESLRDLDNVPFLAPINIALKPIDVVCRFFGGSGVFLGIGSNGYNVKAFNHKTGEIPGKCNFGGDEFGCDRDQIVQDPLLYQHDFAGIIIDACVVSVRVGHHSDDSYNIGENSLGLKQGEVTIGPPHVFDMPPPEHTKFFNDNGINCSSPGVPTSGMNNIGASNTDDCDFKLPAQCGFPVLPPHPPIKSNTEAVCEQKLNQTSCEEPSNPSAPHPAGTCPPKAGDTPSAACSQYLSDQASYDSCQSNPSNCTSGYCASASNRDDPSDRNKRLDAAKNCEQLYAAGAGAPGVGLGNPGAAGTGGGICRTIYEFDTPLKDMEVTTYVPDTDIDASLDGRRLQGPTVFVYFEKKKEFLPMFEGLYFPPRQTIGAYSFAKVYYAQRAGDTGTPDANRQTSNKESLFNPFWGARLELLSQLLFK